METVKNLEDGWYILQDVHDTGGRAGPVYRQRSFYLPASLISEGNSDILTRLPGGTGMNLTYQKEISRGFG